MQRQKPETYLRPGAPSGRRKAPAICAPVVFLAALGACATTPPLPRNAVLDASNHLLASSNFRSDQTQRILLVVTGMPEGPNKIVDSPSSYLDEFFGTQDNQTACAQIYAPSLLGNWGRYRLYLEHALMNARAPVDLVVYSAGVYSLPGLSKELWGRIRSLTLASPFLGGDALSMGKEMSLGTRLFARLLTSRLPPADQFMSSIDDLVESLLSSGVPVAVNLGIGDEYLDNTVISNSFGRYNREGTRVRIEIANRTHGMTARQLNQLFSVSRLSSWRVGTRSEG